MILNFTAMFFLLRGLTVCFCDTKSSALDPEVYEDVVDIIEGKGYEANEYEVLTRDGYYLTLHRISPKFATSRRGRNVVVLQHGLLDSAHTWINNLANQSLGFILSDKGYDVWLANSRGSTYSQRHEHLEPSDTRFWEFSWDDMASYDLPAIIDFIVKNTGTDKVFYVGHSQGTQIAFAQFNEDLKLRSKIVAFVALAPVAYLGTIRSPIRLLAPLCRTVTRARHLIGSGRFLPSNSLIRFLSAFLCGKQRFPFICENIIFLLAGYNPSNTNTTRLPVYVAHTPAGTSVQNIVHYCQSASHGRFQRFDFGRAKNMEVYNQPTPPLYDFKNIDIPVAVFWGGADWLSTPLDVQRILAQLPRTPTKPLSKYLPNYNHMDFVWGMDAGFVLYPYILEFFENFEF